MKFLAPMTMREERGGAQAQRAAGGGWLRLERFASAAKWLTPSPSPLYDVGEKCFVCFGLRPVDVATRLIPAL